MTDYYVRPVNGDDTANGLTPATAWKTFFAATDHGNSRGGTYNCATVTDGDRVFLWAEGTTGGEILTQNFTWYWPLENGNVCCIGVNENGVEDGTRYNIYLNEGWSSGFGVNTNGASNYSAYYPELTGTYEGKANYMWLGKNLRWTESKTIDSSQGYANGTINIGNYMASSRPILYNCESGPFAGTVAGRGLPTQSRYGGDLMWIKCYFHDIVSTGDPSLADITIIGCLFDNVSNTIDSTLYGGGPTIINNVFANHAGNGVIKLNEQAGNEYAHAVIANNVFYNNDGYCIHSEDDQSLNKLHIHNNIFDSNEAVFDLNNITHTYAMGGLSNNIFNNNTNLMLNAGSDTIDDFMSIGFGAGGSGGVGTSSGMDNVLSGAITYVSAVTGPSGDYRLDTTSASGIETGALLMGSGIGNKSGSAAFSVTDSGSLSLGTGGVGDTVTVSGRSFQKISDNPIVWRRV